MIIIDFILGGFLIYGLIKGFMQGFFSALASFVAYILGIYISIQFSYIVGDKIAAIFDWNPNTVKYTAFALTFIIVVVGLFLIAHLFTKLADLMQLGIVNRIMGGLIGAVKFALIISVFLNVFEKMNFNHFFMSEETQNESLFYNPIQKTTQYIYPSIEQLYTDLQQQKEEDATVENNPAETEETPQ